MNQIIDFQTQRPAAAQDPAKRLADALQERRLTLGLAFDILYFSDGNFGLAEKRRPGRGVRPQPAALERSLARSA